MLTPQQTEDIVRRLEHGETTASLLQKYREDTTETQDLIETIQTLRLLRKDTPVPDQEKLRHLLTTLETPVTVAARERSSWWGSLADILKRHSFFWRFSGAVVALAFIIVLAYPGKDDRRVAETRSEIAPISSETEQTENDILTLIDTALAAEDETEYLSNQALGDDILTDIDDTTDNNFFDEYDTIL